MKPNEEITRSKELRDKLTIPQTIIAVIIIVIFGNGYCFSQTYKTGKKMNTTNNGETVYLDKNDPRFISILERVYSDLDETVKAFDPNSEVNKIIALKTQAWSEEKRNESQALGAESINDYAEKTQLDVGTFMMVITSIGEADQQKIKKEWEVRILNLSASKFVAEFWEDGLAVNSEENAVAYAQELANSEYAKKHPESDIGNVEVIKNNYAETRKNIKDGSHERYQKMMALLYSVDTEGLVTFINPLQPSIDFLEKN